MPPILTDQDYREVRAALDVTLEEERLPDEVISMGAYQGAAERDVAARVPQWQTLDDDDRERVRVATILKTAARIAPAMPSITREERLAFVFTQAAVDWVARAAQLNGQADALINELDPTPEAPNDADGFARLIFNVATSRRGG